MISGFSPLVRALMPEASLVLGALLVLGLDIFGAHGRSVGERRAVASAIGLLAVAAALYDALSAGAMGSVFGGVLMLDSLAVATRVAVLILAGLSLAIIGGASRQRHPAEYVAILLFATSGFTLMAAAQQLLVAFLSLELASLSLYVLAGFDKSRPESAEAALKYFLFGGMSAAFLLFGFSILYGLTGSIEVPQIARELAVQGLSPLLGIALVMVLVGFGFKVAAAPFHLWAPDVYQGAPPSSAGLIASASKLAGFVLFARLLWPGLGPVAGGAGAGTAGWLPVAAAVSAASLLVGNFGALAQTDFRRLLGYSAIAHSGAMLLGVMAAGWAGPGPLYYYAATYGLATVGAFGVIAVADNAGGCRRIADLAGLHRRSPFLAACLFVYVLSLAGIPPLAGFFGKLFVFSAALGLAGLSGPAGWLAILAILLSAVALYYYLTVLKQAVVAAPAEGAGRIAVPGAAAAGLAAAAVLIVLLGLFPSAILAVFR